MSEQPSPDIPPEPGTPESKDPVVPVISEEDSLPPSQIISKDAKWKSVLDPHYVKSDSGSNQFELSNPSSSSITYSNINDTIFSHFVYVKVKGEDPPKDSSPIEKFGVYYDRITLNSTSPNIDKTLIYESDGSVQPTICAWNSSIFIFWQQISIIPSADPFVPDVKASSIFLAISSDNGKSFTLGSEIFKSSEENDFFSPAVTLSKRSSNQPPILSLAFIQTEKKNTSESVDFCSQVYFSSSDDLGQSWSSPLNLSKSNPNLVKTPSISSSQVLDDPSLYCVWVDLRLIKTGEELFISRSNDYGVSWTPPSQLTKINKKKNSKNRKVRLETIANQVLKTTIDATFQPDADNRLFLHSLLAQVLEMPRGPIRASPPKICCGIKQDSSQTAVAGSLDTLHVVWADQRASYFSYCQAEALLNICLELAEIPVEEIPLSLLVPTQTVFQVPRLDRDRNLDDPIVAQNEASQVLDALLTEDEKLVIQKRLASKLVRLQAAAPEYLRRGYDPLPLETVVDIFNPKRKKFARKGRIVQSQPLDLSKTIEKRLDNIKSSDENTISLESLTPLESPSLLGVLEETGNAPLGETSAGTSSAGASSSETSTQPQDSTEPSTEPTETSQPSTESTETSEPSTEPSTETSNEPSTPTEETLDTALFPAAKKSDLVHIQNLEDLPTKLPLNLVELETLQLEDGTKLDEKQTQLIKTVISTPDISYSLNFNQEQQQNTDSVKEQLCDLIFLIETLVGIDPKPHKPHFSFAENIDNSFHSIAAEMLVFHQYGGDKKLLSSLLQQVASLTALLPELRSSVVPSLDIINKTQKRQIISQKASLEAAKAVGKDFLAKNIVVPPQPDNAAVGGNQTTTQSKNSTQLASAGNSAQQSNKQSNNQSSQKSIKQSTQKTPDQTAIRYFSLFEKEQALDNVLNCVFPNYEMAPFIDPYAFMKSRGGNNPQVRELLLGQTVSKTVIQDLYFLDAFHQRIQVKTNRLIMFSQKETTDPEKIKIKLYIQQLVFLFGNLYRSMDDQWRIWYAHTKKSSNDWFSSSSSSFDSIPLSKYPSWKSTNPTLSISSTNRLIVSWIENNEAHPAGYCRISNSGGQDWYKSSPKAIALWKKTQKKQYFDGSGNPMPPPDEPTPGFAFRISTGQRYEEILQNSLNLEIGISELGGGSTKKNAQKKANQTFASPGQANRRFQFRGTFGKTFRNLTARAFRKNPLDISEGVSTNTESNPNPPASDSKSPATPSSVKISPTSPSVIKSPSLVKSSKTTPSTSSLSSFPKQRKSFSFRRKSTSGKQLNGPPPSSIFRPTPLPVAAKPQTTHVPASKTVKSKTTEDISSSSTSSSNASPLSIPGTGQSSIDPNSLSTARSMSVLNIDATFLEDDQVFIVFAACENETIISENDQISSLNQNGVFISCIKNTENDQEIQAE